MDTKEQKVIDKSLSVREDYWKDVEQMFDRVGENFFPNFAWQLESTESGNKDISYRSLNLYLGDSGALAKLFGEFLREKTGVVFDDADLLFYVKNSPVFEMRKSGYVQNLVDWKAGALRSWEDGFVDQDLFGDLWYFDENCDHRFREILVSSVSKYGIPERQVECAVEKSLDIWFEKYLVLAYVNRYSERTKYWKHDFEKAEVPTDPLHKELWIEMRKYRYAVDHEQSLKDAGIVVEFMASEKLKQKCCELKVLNDKYRDQRRKPFKRNRRSNIFDGGLDLALDTYDD